MVPSFTGEDSCEFHVHGGLAVVNSVLEALSTVSECSLAEPGEFTKRAFFNGKLDLTEVEGLADLLAAETELQRKQAFLQTQGALSKLYNKWRGVLVKSVAHVEAHIDFEETETIDEGVLEKVVSDVTQLKDEIESHLADGRKGELLRTGVKTVILGEPNVGKSSLLNLLCKRPAAIVTPIEGTTRDILEVTLNIGGYPLVLADTAGLREETHDVIEKEGINRALQNYKNSDLVILVVDSQKYLQWVQCNTSCTVIDFLKLYVNKLGLSDLVSNEKYEFEGLFTKHCLIVFNKLDLVQTEVTFDNKNINFLSCKNEEGVPNLVDSMTQKLKILCGEPSEDHPSMNQMRHRQHLSQCLSCLSTFLTTSSDTVLMAEHLRKALRHLGHLVGVTTTEQLLDVIFKDFCIGK
ncbi:tRNA modification GTPase GTPBP3, mitochondrial isoform X2 [Zophobas morio]|uniref:tRNA modification GTPase GTPBP3, mitochondrial isoform X2 n=1 Tax=Zophobas morio TaxID=2755281 RepID=UPI00308371AA